MFVDDFKVRKFYGACFFFHATRRSGAVRAFLVAAPTNKKLSNKHEDEATRIVLKWSTARDAA